MKRILILFFIISLSFLNPAFAKKKQKPILILTSIKPELSKAVVDNIIPEQYFKANSKIYFMIYVPDGFKSDYIKYQIVQHNDNAHVGGFTRVRNVTCRIKEKNYFEDYFVLTGAGKYFIQIFDIENLQHWLAISSFRVIND